MRRIRRRDFWTTLLQLEDPPRRIALGLAVGVFISCTPLWGLQTILSLVVATLFRLNRLATVAGTWLNLPWFAPFVYGAALTIGSTLLPDPGGARSAWLAYFLQHPGSLSWRDALTLLEQTSLALLVGTTVVGIVAAATTYVVVWGVISARRRTRSGPPSGRSRAA